MPHRKVGYFSILFVGVWAVISCLVSASAQPNAKFNISFAVDFKAAEQLLDFLDHQSGSAAGVAELQGNKLAASTSIMLARIPRSDDDFRRQLALARDNARFENDIYGLLPAKNHIPELRKLLSEVKRRQLDRRVIATIASYFPGEPGISATIPVYIVAMGNERAAAVVRRVVWNGNIPTFVGENEGGPVIILNLVRTLEMAPTVEMQFVEMLSTLAHESFHAIFSLLRQSIADSLKDSTLDEHLLDIVQNEGIAYYLSMQIQIGGRTPSQPWFTMTAKAIEMLNRVILELHSPHLTPARAQELMMNANLSGSFEGNFGATAGMRMAYEIDKHLGRSALSSTLLNGSRSFLKAYQQACGSDAMLPKIDKTILRLLNLE